MTYLIADRHTTNLSLQTPKAESTGREGRTQKKKMREKVRERQENEDQRAQGPKVIRRIYSGSKEEKQSRGTASKFS